MQQRISSTSLRDGTPIAYAVAGHGPPLVYAPGWFTHLELSWAWPAERGFYESLADGRTLVRYDKPGCGLSGSSSRPCSLELELETLEAVAQAVGAERFDLFGASLGAVVAVAWAAAHPDTVDHLVLYGGWAAGPRSPSPAVREHVLGLVSQHWGLGTDVLADIFAPDANAGDERRLRGTSARRRSPETGRDMLALCYQVDMTADLGRVTAPTLVIHRDRDRAAPPEQGEALAAGDPGSDSWSCCRAGRTSRTSATSTPCPAPYGGFSACRPCAAGPVPTLTPRQREVAALVAEGRTNRDIARAARHHRTLGRVARRADPRPHGLPLTGADRRLVRRQRYTGVRYFPADREPPAAMIDDIIEATLDE